MSLTQLRGGNAAPTHAPVLAPVPDTLQDHWVRPSGTATPTVTVVIPTRNEAGNIGHVLERLPKWINQVVLVDGGSTDDTIAIASATWPDITVVHQTTKGKGGALIEGFNAATCDIIVMLDADGSTDPAEIPHFVSALRTGADVAKGSRFAEGGGSSDITGLRSFGNKALVGIVNVLWGSRQSDMCYGYMAFWRSSLDKVVIDCQGFEVETLLVLRFLSAKLRIAEVPSFETPRISGHSNLNAFSDGMRILRTIASERLRPSSTL